MAKFSDGFLARIRETDRLPEILSAQLPLQRAGGLSKCHCPFHKDDSPSFVVYEDHFYCFGCQARGDAIEFFQRKEGLSFPDAVERVAQALGIPPEYQSPDREVSDEQKRFLEKLDKSRKLLEWALDIYSAELNSARGQKARDYLNSRGFGDQVQREFGLGLSVGYDTLSQILVPKKRQLEGVDSSQRAGVQSTSGSSSSELLSLALELKLIKESPRSALGYTDFFQNRLVIPIRDEKGRTLAFGGRRLDFLLPTGTDPKSLPKYLNSSESFLYSKSKNLFLFDKAKPGMRRSRRVILVEGYFDALSLHKVGISEALGVLSASTPDDTFDVLNRTHVQDVFLGFDNDEGGRKAIVAYFKKFFGVGQFQTRCLSFGGFKDPDEYVSAKGREGFLEAMTSAVPLLDRVFQILCAPKGTETPSEKLNLLRREILPKVMAIADVGQKELALERCSQLIGVSREGLSAPTEARPSSKLSARVPSASGATLKDSSEVEARIRPAGNLIPMSPQQEPALKRSEAFWTPRPEVLKLILALYFAHHEDLPLRLRQLFEGKELDESSAKQAEMCAIALDQGLDQESKEVLKLALEAHYEFEGRSLIEKSELFWESESESLFTKLGLLCRRGPDLGADGDAFWNAWLRLASLGTATTVDRRSLGRSGASAKDTRSGKPASLATTRVVVDAALKDLDASAKLGTLNITLERQLLLLEREQIRLRILERTKEALRGEGHDPAELSRLQVTQEELSRKLENFGMDSPSSAI